MSHLTERIAHAVANPSADPGPGGAAEDVQLLYEVASQIRGKCLCALGEFSIEAVLTGIDRFPQDFQLPVLEGS
jgi:NADH:ubiquinone oxidoreductase subunit F (NADH-binding)